MSYGTLWAATPVTNRYTHTSRHITSGLTGRFNKAIDEMIADGILTRFRSGGWADRT
jgi:hypothetical protein